MRFRRGGRTRGSGGGRRCLEWGRIGDGQRRVVVAVAARQGGGVAAGAEESG